MSEPSSGLIEEGVQRLPAHERDRMLLACAHDFAEVWQGLAADAGDEELVTQAVVRGAVVAALTEPRDLDPKALSVIEEFDEAGRDVLATLSLTLAPTELWSVVEANGAQGMIEDIPDWLDDEAYSQRWDEALAQQMSRSWSEAHERRLCVLVARVAAQLPMENYPNASATLAEGCALVAEDPAARRRLAEMLLCDAFDLLDEVQAELDLAA